MVVSKARSFAFIAVATVLFSSMEIALKSVAGRFNALQLNFLRFMIGGLFLLPFALASLKRRGTVLRKGDWAFFAVSGLTCVVLSMSLYQLAIQFCKASIVAVLFSCNPVFAIPLAALVLGERIRRASVASLAASLAGMVCIMNPLGGIAPSGGGAGSPASAGSAANALGIALTIGSAAAFAVYGVMGKTRSARFGGLATTALSFIMGSAMLLALVLASRIPAVAGALRDAGLASFADIPILAGIDLGVLPLFAYISLCVTGIGYAAYFMAIEASSAATASLVFYIKPALAPILALAILGESIAPSTIAGIVLIATGSAISFLVAMRPGRPRAPAPGARP
jgi:drug/metabolite transporter (DMT)-like permease